MASEAALRMALVIVVPRYPPSLAPDVLQPPARLSCAPRSPWLYARRRPRAAVPGAELACAQGYAGAEHGVASAPGAGMDEAPSRIEMRRTVERNGRQLSIRSSRTANQSGTIHIGTGLIPRKAIRRV
jgi:hypothetical protein